MSSKSSFDSPDALLMQALKFSSKDLDANRDGAITEGQKKRIKQQEFGCSIFGWGLVFLCAFMVTAISAPKDSGARLIITFFIGLLVIGIFVHQQETTKVLRQSVVESVHGQLSASAPYDKRHHWIQVLDKQFPVIDNVYAAFREGETYTIYYMPQHNQTILSAEYHEPPSAPEKLKPRLLQNIQRRPEKGL